MSLHFAYGANMHRAVMHKHAPSAQPIGAAVLPDHGFLITADGYASVEAARGQAVWGVLWRLSARDCVTLDQWEDIAGRLYRRATMTVRQGGHHHRALIYVARRPAPGRPKPGYMDLVLDAARAWDLPPAHIAALQKWLPPQAHAAGARSLMEFVDTFR